MSPSSPRGQGEADFAGLPLAFGSWSQACEQEAGVSRLAQRLADLEASRFFLGLERLLQAPGIVEIWYRPHLGDLCVRVPGLQPESGAASAWEFVDETFSAAEELELGEGLAAPGAPARRERLLAQGALVQSFQSEADALMSRFDQRAAWRWGARLSPFTSPLALAASPAADLARACLMPEIAALMERQILCDGLGAPSEGGPAKTL